LVVLTASCSTKDAPPPVAPPVAQTPDARSASLAPPLAMSPPSPPGAIAETTATATPPSSCPISAARAMELLLQRDEVRARQRDLGRRLVVLAAPSCTAADASPNSPTYEIDIEGQASTPSYRVNARTGDVSASSACRDRSWVAWSEHERELGVLKRVEALPEVSGFATYVRRASKGSVGLATSLEECPSARQPAYRVYVGEAHADHTVRWSTFIVDPKTRAMSVEGASGGLTLYAAWATTKSAKEMATQLRAPRSTASPST
jgi:hypothetical protein